MAALFDLTNTNLSYYTVPAAFVILMIPNFYAGIAAGKSFDPAQPRKIEETVAKDQSLDKVTIQRIQRARAAAANGLETLGFYAAAVVAANTSGVPTAKLNKLTLAYLAARVAYNYVYVVLQDNRKLAGLRPPVWMVGIGIIFALFISAARASSS